MAKTRARKNWSPRRGETNRDFTDVEQHLEFEVVVLGRTVSAVMAKGVPTVLVLNS
jgi:hypothetical protein